MIKILIFSINNYYLAKYLKNRESSYLFIGSLMIALNYIMEPIIIFLIPIYAAVFYFSCDEFCYRKRLTQFFVFIFPTIAAAFSLSYISWIYDRGFRLIYLKNDFLSTAVKYSGYKGIYQFLINTFPQIVMFALPYLFILLWILIYKGITRSYFYFYLMPIFLHTLRYILIDFKADYRFYIIYLLYAFFYFILFKSEIRKYIKIIFLLIFILNSSFLIYKMFII